MLCRRVCHCIFYIINHRKALIYRSANAIFGKIGRIASEDEILQLIKSKCIPSLLYGFDACALTKSEPFLLWTLLSTGFL